MNYKKKKTAFVDGKLYNLENWVSIAVERTEFKNKEGKREIENRLNIYLPQTKGDRVSHVLTVNWEGICEHCLWVHLGVDKSELEKMFLAKECED